MRIAAWVEAAKENSIMYDTVEVLLKGPEKTLPNKLSIKDTEGKKREKARLAWWKSKPKTWAEAVDPSVALPELHDYSWQGDFHSYSGEKKPVFFGHYKRTLPVCLDAGNAFCLDYSGGNEGGRLTAYRFDPSHSAFDPARIVSVPA